MQNKRYSLTTLLVFALLLLVAAFLLDRTLFKKGPPDSLSQQIEALDRELAASRLQRDSLEQINQNILARLEGLENEERILADSILTLATRIQQKDRTIRSLRQNFTNHESIPDDTLLLDLNRILHELMADSSAIARTTR